MFPNFGVQAAVPFRGTNRELGQSRMLKLILDPTSLPVLKALDFWLGCVGFLVTIGGFALAWKKLKKVEVATTAAAKAVEGFKLRISRYDAANDASGARYSLAAIPKYLDAMAWRDIAEAMTDTRHAISRMMPAVEAIDPKLTRELKRMVTSLEKTISVIDDASAGQSANPTATDVRKMVRGAVDTMHKVQRLLEERL